VLFAPPSRGGRRCLQRRCFPHRLWGIRDPMSGFFLFRRDAMTQPMTPRGFKILLEMAVRHPDLTRCEVPFVFVERVLGHIQGHRPRRLPLPRAARRDALEPLVATTGPGPKVRREGKRPGCVKECFGLPTTSSPLIEGYRAQYGARTPWSVWLDLLLYRPDRNVMASPVAA
jgi:hypothetical protein